MRALALVLLLAACAPPPEPPIPVGHLGISRSLLTHLDSYYGSMEKEVAVLLFGVQDGLVVRIVGIDDAHMIHSTPYSGSFVSHHPKDDKRVVGFLHNHPGSPDHCTPSHADIKALYDNPSYRVAIVACGKGNFGAALRGHGIYLEFSVADGHP